MLLRISAVSIGVFFFAFAAVLSCEHIIVPHERHASADENVLNTCDDAFFRNVSCMFISASPWRSFARFLNKTPRRFFRLSKAQWH
jgi:hypothetical protein